MGCANGPSIPGTLRSVDHQTEPAEPLSYFDLNRFTGALIQTRETFGNDLDLFLFQLVLQLDRMAPARDGRSGAHRQRGVNALSVAEITGVPRETTRRKLLALAHSGAVARLPDNLYYATGPSDRLLASVRALAVQTPRASFEDNEGWIAP